MIDFFLWWICFVLLGWAIFPVIFHIFRHLSTKGFGLSKIFALLLGGYIFWVGNTFSLLSNSRNGVIFVFVTIIVISVLYYRKCKDELIGWTKKNIQLIIFSEILFISASLFMLLLRGFDPAIIGTEKPMELAFLNGIFQSTYFPPHDPWLSGYSISYYYFGYLIINLFMKLFSTSSGVAFNLSLIFWFGLIAIGSSDVLINMLISSKKFDMTKQGNTRFKVLLASLLAPIFILILSNAEGLLELLHSKGLFWEINDDGITTSPFWEWIDIKELSIAPPIPFDWNIQRPGSTWWWRASRVLQDYTLANQPREIINEFPFFSFYLGDLHPHLLAVPFVLLSLSAALEFLFRRFEFRKINLKAVISYFQQSELWLLGLILGSLIFLNTWDFPIYFGLFALVLFIKGMEWDKKNGQIVAGIFLPVFILGFISIILYLPFLISFSSQAGGVIPSMIFQSRTIHQLIMFLPLILPIGFFIFYSAKINHSFTHILKIFLVSVGVFIFGLSLSLLVSIFVANTSSLLTFISRIIDQDHIFRNFALSNNTAGFLSTYQADSLRQLILTTLRKIVIDPWFKLLMLFFIASSVSIVLSRKKTHKDVHQNWSAGDVFFGFLLLLAALLILFPELFYLRDQFGWRMNTIFKFYFQAWILLSICASYALVQIVLISNRALMGILTVIVVLGTISGFVYPFYALKERINWSNIHDIDINGNSYFYRSNPGEMEAVMFLENSDCGVIAEAVGGSYSNFARISKFTGCPAVLGWPGHELQWRGSSDPLGSREEDIKILYTTNDWLTARNILETYHVQYVVVGDLERSAYTILQQKFDNNMLVVFKNDTTVIYQRIKYE